MNGGQTLFPVGAAQGLAHRWQPARLGSAHAIPRPAQKTLTEELGLDSGGSTGDGVACWPPSDLNRQTSRNGLAGITALEPASSACNNGTQYAKADT